MLLSVCLSESGMLHLLIRNYKTGFMSNRYIGNNIRIIYDVMYYSESRNIPGMFLKVEFEKAFQCIYWPFIHKTLGLFGFGEDIKRWTVVFYYNKASVIVNGNASSSFPVNRSGRQRDPLSPYVILL